MKFCLVLLLTLVGCTNGRVYVDAMNACTKACGDYFGPLFVDTEGTCQCLNGATFIDVTKTFGRGCR